MYTVSRWFGREERDLPPERFKEVIDQLGDADSDHPDVALRHESEWCLSYFRGGLLVFENVEDGEPRFMKDVSPEHTVRLWTRLAAGDLHAIEGEPWLPGYGR